MQEINDKLDLLLVRAERLSVTLESHEHLDKVRFNQLESRIRSRGDWIKMIGGLLLGAAISYVAVALK